MKRVTPKQYARAFWEVAKESKDHKSVVEKFVGLLKRTGAWSKREIILKEIEKLQTNESRVLVESARELEKNQKEELEKGLGKKGMFEYKINPDLMAGVRVTVDGSHQLDVSLRSIVRKVLN